MTVKGGTTPACAACKYQRRKCSPNCPLAPYFPANNPKMFQNVHRLFGVSNVTKTLEKLQTKEQQDDAMTSIIYEAEMRQRYRVHGCCYVISQLFQQINLLAKELQNLRALIQEQQQLNSPSCWPPQHDVFPKQELMMPPPAVAPPYYSAENTNSRPLLTLDETTIQQQMDLFSLQEGGNDDFEVICHDNYMATSESSSFEDANVVKTRLKE